MPPILWLAMCLAYGFHYLAFSQFPIGEQDITNFSNLFWAQRPQLVQNDWRKLMLVRPQLKPIIKFLKTKTEGAESPYCFSNLSFVYVIFLSIIMLD